MSRPQRCWAALGIAAALAIGLYGRFTGLGAWPFGVDEYYISRSVDHILKTGWPRFPCGSYYTRGLLYQYLVALARETVGSPEQAARLVSGVWSLAAGPAAYLLGRRLQGRWLGWLLVVILSLSVWEIEMARYARMYAPFQAVFLWYLYCFVRYAIDGRRGALIAMVLLSIIGVATWEGGTLLGVLNLLAPFLRQDQARLRAKDAFYLAAMLVLLALLFRAVADPREAVTAATEGAVAVSPDEPPSRLVALAVGSVRAYPGWLLLYMAGPLAWAALSGRWLWRLRHRWIAAGGLSLALLAALAHQFVLCLAVLLLVPLTGLIRSEEFWQREARRYRWALGLCLGFWVSFALATGAWHATLLPSSPATERWLALGQYLGGFPYTFREFLVPWGKAVTGVTLGALVLVAALMVHVLRDRSGATRLERAMLVVVIVMLLAVGAHTSGRVETRYTFFIYPLVLALCLRSITVLASHWCRTEQTVAVGATVAGLLLFFASEDFQPRHIAFIDSRAVNFRVGMTSGRANHYYARADYRLAGDWVRRQRQPGDLVLLGIPTIDQYYDRADLFFLQDDDSRYEVYACAFGNRERWTNLPLVHGMAALAAKRTALGRLVIMMYPGQAAALLSDGLRRGWRGRLEWVTPEQSVAAVLFSP